MFWDTEYNLSGTVGSREPLVIARSSDTGLDPDLVRLMTSLALSLSQR